MLSETDMEPVMATLRRAYPRQQWDAATTKVWAAALGDQELPDIAAAVAELVQTSKWPPSIAEVREIAIERAQVRRDRLTVGRITRSMQLPAHTDGPNHKADLQRENIRRWQAGEITAAQMAIESARIYAEEGARPADGLDMMRQAREAAGGMGAGDGPLAAGLRRNMRQLRPRGGRSA